MVLPLPTAITPRVLLLPVAERLMVLLSPVWVLVTLLLRPVMPMVAELLLPMTLLLRLSPLVVFVVEVSPIFPLIVVAIVLSFPWTWLLALWTLPVTLDVSVLSLP